MKGILLVQLGTPNSPQPKDVGRYLREFLMDPLVIDIPWALRLALVNLIIVPFRSHKSAEAYSKIWTSEGSPLRFHSEKFAKGVQERCPDFPVALAMRYGEPSIQSVISGLSEKGVDDLFVVPLYPQYASASTQTAIDEVNRVVSRLSKPMAVRFLHHFYREPEFIEAFCKPLREVNLQSFDHFLISFHGIPERQNILADESGQHCLKSPSCCEKPSAAIAERCYRYQCLETARLLAENLNLPKNKWSVSFQSRLGRTPWLQPFTDQVLLELPKAQKKKVAVLCPSFVADCLETLEEIKMRGHESFLAAGGDELVAVPCPNSEALWIEGFTRILKRRAA